MSEWVRTVNNQVNLRLRFDFVEYPDVEVEVVDPPHCVTARVPFPELLGAIADLIMMDSRTVSRPVCAVKRHDKCWKWKYVPNQQALTSILRAISVVLAGFDAETFSDAWRKAASLIAAAAAIIEKPERARLLDGAVDWDKITDFTGGEKDEILVMLDKLKSRLDSIEEAIVKVIVADPKGEWQTINENVARIRKLASEAQTLLAGIRERTGTG